MGFDTSLKPGDILMYIALAGGVSVMAHVGYHELRRLKTKYMLKRGGLSDKNKLVERVINLEARSFFDDEQYDIKSNSWIHGVPIIGEIIKVPETTIRRMTHLLRYRKPKCVRVYPRQESNDVNIKVELAYDGGVKTTYWKKKLTEMVDFPQSKNFLERNGYVVFQM